MLNLKASSISKGVVKDIIIVVVGVLIIWIGLQIIFGTTNPFYVVSSGSMIPELQVYDVLVVQGNDPFEEVEIGDVIVFNRPSGHDRVIVHRVASIIDENPFTIRTKGDANPSSIPGTDFPITEEEYIGQVAYVIPQVGYVTQVLTPPINYIIIAIIIGIMIFKQMSKKKSEEELGFTDPYDSTKPAREEKELGDKKIFDKEELKTDSYKKTKANEDEKLSKTLETDELPKDNEYSKSDEKPEFSEKGSSKPEKKD